ncbi:MAG: hypothetical protein JWM68_3748 [Verrucomicrobiales bacterium]|nr:hypothetical protein [Verrucomicrobiales bacterium]
MKAPKKKRLPLLKSMCATCPFREGSPHAHLAPALELSARTEASRICHSTGSSAINYRTGKPPMLCRGARDIQLQQFFHMGFIEAPTDEAWESKCKQMNL